VSGVTDELALALATDSDDEGDYLTRDLVNTLRKVDGQFNAAAGHNHNGAHQGAAISLPPGSAAANIGPLSGALTGTLPSPGIATGAVGLNQIAANSVDTNRIIDGTIQPADLASGVAFANLGAGSINALIGSNANYPGGWSWVTPNAWTEMPLTVTGTFTGAPVRVDYSLSAYASTAGAFLSFGIGRDGTLDWQLSRDHMPTASGSRTFHGSMYYSNGLAAGSHRIGIFINFNVGGASIDTAALAALFVWEMRK
jgi:hypothetical protein